MDDAGKFRSHPPAPIRLQGPDRPCGPVGSPGAARGERDSGAAAAPLGPPTPGAARRPEPLHIKGCPGHRANLAEVAAPSHFTVCLGNNRKAFAKLERLLFFFLMRGGRGKEKAGQGRRTGAAHRRVSLESWCYDPTLLLQPPPSGEARSPGARGLERGGSPCGGQRLCPPGAAGPRGSHAPAAPGMGS